MTRLDVLLVARGLYGTRARARDAIRRGTIRVEGRIAEKPGMLVASDATIAVDDPAQGFVSRGALKLAHALDHFGLSPDGADCLDIGASTGGFTEVLLRRGAKSVTAVDVGQGQLAAVLAEDPRVTALSGINARDLTAGHLTVPPDFIVADVSFISLLLVLPPALALGQPRCTPHRAGQAAIRAQAGSPVEGRNRARSDGMAGGGGCGSGGRRGAGLRRDGGRAIADHRRRRQSGVPGGGAEGRQ